MKKHLKHLLKHSTANNPVLRVVAALMFIVFPIIGFVLGMQYQGKVSSLMATDFFTAILKTRAQAPRIMTYDEIIGWKTYANKDGKYSLKYPADYALTEVAGSTDCKKSLKINASKTASPDATLGSIIIDSCTSTDEASLKTALNDVKGQTQKDVIVDGKKGFMKAGTMTMPKSKTSEDVKSVVVFENGMQYRLSWYYDAKKDTAEDERIFNKILSTFTVMKGN